MNNINNFVSKEAFVSVKPLFVDLLKNLSETYKNVTILVEKSVGKNYRTSKSGTTIKDNTFASTGAVIRLNHSYGSYEFSFNDFSKEYIDLIPKKISENIVNKKDLYNSNFCTNNFNKNSPNNDSNNKITFNEATNFGVDPLSLSDEYISNTLTKILNKALNFDSQIIDCICVFQYLQVHKMFLSDTCGLTVSSNLYHQHMTKLIIT